MKYKAASIILLLILLISSFGRAGEAAGKENLGIIGSFCTEEEIRLLSAVIYCEAQGEPYAGKLAVGIVVMNRVDSDSFPDTLKEVIYQKDQFGPVKNGTLKNALQKFDRGDITEKDWKYCIMAAIIALSGVKEVSYNQKTYAMQDYLYFNGTVNQYRLQIAGHQFR